MKKQTQLLRVSDNKRFLTQEDGTPFFWLGDTAWHLFHRLNREEAEKYLINRAERRFNVIQAVALAECDGLRTTNVYGVSPLLQNEAGEYDPTKPDLRGEYCYWDHIDYVIDKAAELGLYIGFLPTWGDKFNIYWGKGPVIFNPENAKVYGQWLGERYKDKSNIIWILGGDRPLDNEEHYAIMRGMAEGLALGDEGRHLITMHPPGNRSSSMFVHKDEWLSFNMVQSGHNCKEVFNYKMIYADYCLEPVKPVLEGEPCYEEHVITNNFDDGFYTDYEARRAAYWGVFAGGFGHTFGNHCVWSMNTEPARGVVSKDWKEAIESRGASQMQYVRNLLESRPFLERVPDQGLVAEEFSDLDHIRATRGIDYAFVYTPTGKELRVNMGIISGDKVTAYWYEPGKGSASIIGEFENKGVVSFIPPCSGEKNDWVLVLDDSSKCFPRPGTL